MYIYIYISVLVVPVVRDLLIELDLLVVVLVGLDVVHDLDVSGIGLARLLPRRVAEDQRGCVVRPTIIMFSVCIYIYKHMYNNYYH